MNRGCRQSAGLCVSQCHRLGDRSIAHPQAELVRGTAGTSCGHDYLTDELTAQAVQFLEREAHAPAPGRKPFFLYLCHFAAHTPFQAPSEDVAYFERKASRG